MLFWFCLSYILSFCLGLLAIWPMLLGLAKVLRVLFRLLIPFIGWKAIAEPYALLLERALSMFKLELSRGCLPLEVIVKLPVLVVPFYFKLDRYVFVSFEAALPRELRLKWCEATFWPYSFSRCLGSRKDLKLDSKLSSIVGKYYSEFLVSIR